jgi:hypothetical protein
MSIFMRNVYVTAFGEIDCCSPVYFRARRLERKFGRDAEKYLEEWARYQFINGRDIMKMKECKAPFLRPDARAAHNGSSSTPSGDSIVMCAGGPTVDIHLGDIATGVKL